MRPLFLPLLLLLIVLGPHAAMAASCPDATAPRVTATLTQDPVHQDRLLGIRDLKKLYATTDNGTVAETPGHFPLGLTVTDARYDMNVEALVSTLSDGTICAALKELTVHVRFADVKVHVARELPYGSCIEHEVLAHENRHVAVDRDLVQGWQPNLQQAVEKAARNLGSLTVTSARNGPAALGDRLKPALESAMNQLLAERARRQAEVDSPEEYARFSHVCDGAAPRIARREAGN